VPAGAGTAGGEQSPVSVRASIHSSHSNHEFRLFRGAIAPRRDENSRTRTTPDFQLISPSFTSFHLISLPGHRGGRAPKAIALEHGQSAAGHFDVPICVHLRPSAGESGCGCGLPRGVFSALLRSFEAIKNTRSALRLCLVLCVLRLFAANQLKSLSMNMLHAKQPFQNQGQSSPIKVNQGDFLWPHANAKESGNREKRAIRETGFLFVYFAYFAVKKVFLPGI